MKWTWESAGSEFQKSDGWRLYVGDEPTFIYAATPAVGEQMAELLSYGSAAPYLAKLEPIPRPVPANSIILACDGRGVAALIYSGFPCPSDAELQQSAELHCQRLNHAAEVPEERREMLGLVRPPSDAEAAAAADKLAETFTRESRIASAMPEHAQAARLVVESNERASIGNCYACDARHEGIALHEYKTPNPPWTHWFTCPNTGDPVPVTLVQSRGLAIEIHNAILRRVMQAQASGSFMVAIFRREPKEPTGYTIFLNRETHRFPNDDYEAVIEQFANNLRDELGPMKAKPLPPATPPKRPTLHNSPEEMDWKNVNQGDMETAAAFGKKTP